MPPDRPDNNDCKVEMDDTLDLVIIGEGVDGIAATFTYLSLHREHHTTVLEADEDVGGVWSRSRLDRKFFTQSGIRVRGFPDRPFDPPAEAVKRACCRPTEASGPLIA